MSATAGTQNSEFVKGTDQTQLENLQQNLKILANASAGDAKHDFGDFPNLLRYVKDDKNEFSSGLPSFKDTPYYELLDEDAILTSIISEVNDTEVDDNNGSPKFIYKPIDFFEERYNNNKRNIFEKHTIKTTTDFTFNVSGISALLNPSSYDRKSESEDKYTDAKSLIDGLGLKHRCALVIDHMTISLLTILTKGEKLNKDGNDWTPANTERFEIFIIDCVETRNDPCGKTLWDKKYDTDNGVLLIFLEPFDPQVVSYSFTEPVTSVDWQTPQQMFFSSYNFKLATDYDGAGCNLLITNNEGELALAPVEVKDPKYENAIEYIAGLLEDILNKWINSNNKVSLFNANAKYQQKRSGDWLQVLACFLVLQRTWKVANRTKNSTYAYGGEYETSNITGGVYFKTHDRIALAYALLLGVNSIFSHGSSSTIVCFELEKSISQKLNNVITRCDNFFNELKSYYNSEVLVSDMQVSDAQVSEMQVSDAQVSDTQQVYEELEVSQELQKICKKFSEKNSEYDKLCYKLILVFRTTLSEEVYKSKETLLEARLDFNNFQEHIKSIFEALACISEIDMLCIDPESLIDAELLIDPDSSIYKSLNELVKNINFAKRIQDDDEDKLKENYDSQNSMIFSENIDEFVIKLNMQCELLSGFLNKIKNNTKLITESSNTLKELKSIVIKLTPSDQNETVSADDFTKSLTKAIIENNSFSTSTQELLELIHKLDFFDLKIFGKFTARSVINLEISKLDCLQFLQGFSNIPSFHKKWIHSSFSEINSFFSKKMKETSLTSEEKKISILFTSFFHEILITFPDPLSSGQSVYTLQNLSEALIILKDSTSSSSALSSSSSSSSSSLPPPSSSLLPPPSSSSSSSSSSPTSSTSSSQQQLPSLSQSPTSSSSLLKSSMVTDTPQNDNIIREIVEGTATVIFNEEEENIEMAPICLLGVIHETNIDLQKSLTTLMVQGTVSFIVSEREDNDDGVEFAGGSKKGNKNNMVGGSKPNCISYLRKKRRDLLLKEYFSKNPYVNSEYTPSSNTLLFLMIGIAMINQLDNSEICYSLEYDTYTQLFDIINCYKDSIVYDSIPKHIQLLTRQLVETYFNLDLDKTLQKLSDSQESGTAFGNESSQETESMYAESKETDKNSGKNHANPVTKKIKRNEEKEIEELVETKPLKENAQFLNYAFNQQKSESTHKNDDEKQVIKKIKSNDYHDKKANEKEEESQLVETKPLEKNAQFLNYAYFKQQVYSAVLKLGYQIEEEILASMLKSRGIILEGVKTPINLKVEAAVKAENNLKEVYTELDNDSAMSESQIPESQISDWNSLWYSSDLNSSVENTPIEDRETESIEDRETESIEDRETESEYESQPDPRFLSKLYSLLKPPKSQVKNTLTRNKGKEIKEIERESENGSQTRLKQWYGGNSRKKYTRRKYKKLNKRKTINKKSYKKNKTIKHKKSHYKKYTIRRR